MDIAVDQVQLPFVSRSRYRALVLDPGMQPIDVVNWQRALVLDMLAKVEVLEYYQDVTVNSVSAEFFLPAVLMAKKVGRNAPCPCGSGRKAKKCSATADCLGAWRS